MLTDFCGNLLFLSVAGGAIQWSVSIREPPCGSGVVPLHERTSSLQLPVRTWGCRIQTIPFSGDWEHPCHWSQTPFWNSGRIQCKGELSLNLKMFYATFIRYIGYNADKWRWHIPVLYYVFGIEYGANCKIHTFMWLIKFYTKWHWIQCRLYNDQIFGMLSVFFYLAGEWWWRCGDRLDFWDRPTPDDADGHQTSRHQRTCQNTWTSRPLDRENIRGVLRTGMLILIRINILIHVNLIYM